MSLICLDCARSAVGKIKRLRFRVIHRLRVLGRGNRIHEWPVPHEQGHCRPVRLQKRWQRRTAWYSCRASPRRPSPEEQRAPCRGASATSADGSIRGASTHAWLPRTVPRAVRRRTRCRTTPATRRIHPSTNNCPPGDRDTTHAVAYAGYASTRHADGYAAAPTPRRSGLQSTSRLRSPAAPTWICTTGNAGNDASIDDATTSTIHASTDVKRSLYCRPAVRSFQQT